MARGGTMTRTKILGLLMLGVVAAGCGDDRSPTVEAKATPTTAVTVHETSVVMPLEAATATTRRPAASSTSTPRKVTIVQSASSDAAVEDLRRQVETLRAEVASLRQRVDAQANTPTTSAQPYDPRPLEDRVTQLERQVGIHSPNRKLTSSLWDEIERLKNCMKYDTYC